MGNIIGKIWEEITGPTKEEKYSEALKQLFELKKVQWQDEELLPNRAQERLERAKNRLEKARDQLEVEESKLEMQESQAEIKEELEKVKLKEEILKCDDETWLTEREKIQIKIAVEKIQVGWKVQEHILERSKNRVERARSRWRSVEAKLPNTKNQLEVAESKLEKLESYLELEDSSIITDGIEKDQIWDSICTRVQQGETDIDLSNTRWDIASCNFFHSVSAINRTKKEIEELKSSKNKCEEESVGSKSAGQKAPSTIIGKAEEVNLREEQYKQRKY